MTNDEQVVTKNDDSLISQNTIKALVAFILSIAGLTFALTAILSVPGLVMGIISLAFAKSCDQIEKRPYKAFKNVAKKISIAAIVVGAFLATALTICLIGWAIYIAYKNGTQATA